MVELNGRPLVFSIEEVSMLDINALIDKGTRFTLKAAISEDEVFDDLQKTICEVE